MPSTSKVCNKPNNQRNSSNANYNETSIISSQIPRQILPMSRPTTVQAYQQPQLIVPTQCGYGDVFPKEISSTVFLPMEYFDNMQTNYFGQVQPYTNYFPQQQQQQQIYSQQMSINQMQQYNQALFMSKQHVQVSQQQQQQQQQQDSQFDASMLCDDCRLSIVSVETFTLQNLCNKCKSRYITFTNYRNSVDEKSFARTDRNKIYDLQQQQQQNVQRVVPRPQQLSTPMNNQMTSPHVVPTQTFMPLESSISDYSMPANLSDPIDYSLDQSPTICYEESCDKNSYSKNSVLNDVFFSDLMIDDIDEVLHFDSDSSSDTDILTPGQRSSPPLSPTDLMSSDDLLLNIIGEESFDLSKDKPSSTETSSWVAISSSSSLSSESNIKSTTVQITPPPSITDTISTSSTQDIVNPPLFNSSINSTPSTTTTIDPTLISVSSFSSDSTEMATTIDPRFITSSVETSSTVAVKRLPPVITRPNHIEFGDGIPSPPLKTPELVSDNSVKRKMSYESSSEDDTSDVESNDKRAQKKLRVDIKKSVKVNKRNDEDEEEDDEDDESDSEESSNFSVIDNDDDMDSANEVQDVSDNVTDEYHYTSDDSEEDDDEEYRPTSNNKKSRTTRKAIKPQGKSRAALSKKTKSRNKSKATSTKRGRQSSKTSKPSSKRSSGVSSPVAVPIESPPQCFASPAEESQEMEGVEITSPRLTQSPTIFQILTKSQIDWCRYCGTTEGVNWRPGPWGKRTLCNKHGCDYKGYGFACKLPRLDLTGFVNESVEDRDRPVLQLFCTVCQKQESYVGNVLVRCEGCPKAFHQKCCSTQISDEVVSNTEQWFCESGCSDNVRRKRIVVELPRKKLPLMSTPKVQVPASTIESGAAPSGTVSRPRTSRNSSRV